MEKVQTTLDELVAAIGTKLAGILLYNLQDDRGGLTVSFCTQNDSAEENMWVTPWNSSLGFNENFTAVDIEGSVTACAGKSKIHVIIEKEDWHLVRLEYNMEDA